MATFPSLTPSVRVYNQGDFPSSIQTLSTGIVKGFRLGNRRINQTLQLTFNNLTEAQVTLIRNHYDTQQGSFSIFFLSAECWSGYSTLPVPLVSDFAWLYSQPPTISDGIVGKFNVEVELVTVPINIGDLIFDALDATTTARSYILDAGSSATTARDYIIDARTSIT
tara:strand:- start:368 stop:868 length:501 start_codon:yes stop_codon:yes gene_type:complete